MRPAVGILIIAAVALGGCGFNVASPDLFLLTRTGQGRRLTLVVNDDGTVRCNRGPSRMLSNDLLLKARDLASNLDKDAKAKLTLPRTPNSIYVYTVKLQGGRLAFPDTAAATHRELAQVELFAVQAAQSACGVS